MYLNYTLSAAVLTYMAAIPGTRGRMRYTRPYLFEGLSSIILDIFYILQKINILIKLCQQLKIKSKSFFFFYVKLQPNENIHGRVKLATDLGLLDWTSLLIHHLKICFLQPETLHQSTGQTSVCSVFFTAVTFLACTLTHRYTYT